MAIEHEPFDDADDERLERLLALACRAPAMRSEFVSALAGRLDAEFAADGDLMPTPSANGSTSRAIRGASLSDAEAATTVTSVATQPRTKRWRRWTIAVAMAASLLAAVAIAMDPPAFAAMIRAIVTTIGEFTIGGGDRVAPAKPEAAEPVDVEVRVVVPPPVDVPAAPDVQPQAAVEEAHAVVPEADWQPFAAPLATDELSRRLDELLHELWHANGIQPVEPVSDTEFLRRVHLDLTGRIPTVGEVHEFLDDPSPDRRERLVDRLLEHRDHATHLAAVWRGILLEEGPHIARLGGVARFDEWFAERFAANVPYDQIVRELLLAEGRVAESGPLLFYAALRLNPEELASRTSRAFLGVRMECAQCHDHPYDELSQHDFWSFAAFFARISRPRGKMEMTSPVLQVRDNEHGDVTIPDTDEVVPPRLPSVATGGPPGPEALRATGEPPVATDLPRREQLVDWLTSPSNGQFARATVNRVWAHLFGRGLVEPVDDMRPANRPIAPEVLETLSRDFASSGFDMRRLLRGLVLTDAYQLSSRSPDDDPSRRLLFAQMNVKSLTAEQLYDCIAVATRQPGLARGPAEDSGLLRFDDMSRQAFVEKFRAPAGQATEYHAGIPQALTLMHGGLIHGATDVASSGLLKSLAAPFFTDEQRLDALFLSTLSRYPHPAERDVMLGVIAAATTEAERQQALGDILWALLNSAEFTFNH